MWNYSRKKDPGMMFTRKRCDLYSLCFYANVILLFYFASAYTDPLDVKSLEDLYGLLNQPTMLTGWMATGGDPCGQNWTGVSCSGSSIISIHISGLGLGGTVSSQLSSFLSLTQLDMSYNNISGEIPYGLPPNSTLINFAGNRITGNIPMSLPSLKNLKYLNVSNNHLFGVVNNAFTDMTSLEILDISYNSFSGDLPSSFDSLQNLHFLYLQHNQFTGSVNLFTKLPLTKLNIENNNFSDYVAKHFELIPELRIEGNKFEPRPHKRSQRVYHRLSEKFKYIEPQIKSPGVIAFVAITTFMLIYGMMAQSPPPAPPMPHHLPHRQARQRAPVSAPPSPPSSPPHAPPMPHHLPHRQARQRAPVSAPPSPPSSPPHAQAPLRIAPSPSELTWKFILKVVFQVAGIMAGFYCMMVYVPPELPQTPLFRKIVVGLGDYILYIAAVLPPVWLLLLLARKIRNDSKFVAWSMGSFIILLAIGSCFKCSVNLVLDATP